MNASDMMQRRLTELGNASARLKARGECDHGWTQTRMETNGHIERMQPLRIGECLCLHCGAIFASEDECRAIGREVLLRECDG